MCGIAGMYNFKKNDLQLDYFSWCLSSMNFRGPDAASVWHNSRNYITAFVRLSVRDLSHYADQPMLSDCGNYCLSFNGEIYNTEILKRYLRPHRIDYLSTSDTEILLYALIHLGLVKTLEIIDGIFAFAFYDLAQNRLSIARDRLGIKPLYLGISTEGIVYSSQYNHIINHSYFKDESIDEAVLSSCLALGYMSENKGIISKTSLFPHGYFMVVENGKADLHQYYSYHIGSSSREPAFLEESLHQSVREQLVSDVALGSFMSGGIDSTLISYFANQEIPLKTFTLGVSDSLLDERVSAGTFAENFKTEHYVKTITSAELCGLIKENQEAFSEPFSDYSSLPTLAISQFAKQKVTVALSGDGADELFWGYPRSRKALNLIDFYQKNFTKRRIHLLFEKAIKPSGTDVTRHWSEIDFIDYYYHSLWITGAQKWLPLICNARPSEPFFLAESRAYFLESNRSKRDWMNIIRKMEVDIHLQRILLKVDHASMFHSLEVRVPFLSNAIIDLSRDWKYSDCISENYGKKNLRMILGSKVSPDLLGIQKKGFTIPIGEWIRKEIRKEVVESILDMPQSLAYFFNRNYLERLLNSHNSGKEDLGWLIWSVFSLVKWDYVHRNKY